MYGRRFVSRTMSTPKERLVNNRRKGHEVPEYLQERRGSASFAVDVEVPKLTHAERAKTLLFRQKTGLLSTLAHEDGSPFGSIVNFAFDDKGDLFFLASKLAEHTANLEKDNRGSLLVTEEQGDGDKLAVSRVTVVGQLQKTEKTKDIVTNFKQRHPTANYVMFDDFYVFKFNPVHRVRFIAGFGEMSWVKGKEFDSSQPDPISSDVQGTSGAIKHMNADHADANILLLKFAVPPLPSVAKSSTMLNIDRYGMDFLAETSDGKRLVRVPFPKPLQKSEEVKTIIVEMTKRSRL